jgi:endo-beta-N-acetylglucosaminidase D
MVVKSELITLGKKLVLLEGTIRLKEPQKIRMILKSIIKIKHKTKNTLKRYSALTNTTHRHVEIDVRSLGKGQNVKNNVKLRRVRVTIVAVEKL